MLNKRLPFTRRAKRQVYNMNVSLKKLSLVFMKFDIQNTLKITVAIESLNSFDFKIQIKTCTANNFI